MSDEHQPPQETNGTIEAGVCGIIALTTLTLCSAGYEFLRVVVSKEAPNIFACAIPALLYFTGIIVFAAKTRSANKK